MLRFVNVLWALLLAAPVLASDPTGRIRVVDGDTLKVGGVTVRLHGIDAPEMDQTCRDGAGVDWRCGRWVTQVVTERYEGKRARCKTIEQDKYGRDVARCTVRGNDLGKVLVSDGRAFAYRYYSMAYDLDEKAAAVRRAGLHGYDVQSPAAFRKAQRSTPADRADGCVIKGNLSRSGARIYHVPGQENYARTRISPQKGERWFCNEAEARAAGWRRAKR
ncbi:thermonuclease family protein [Aliishimia ponticola]|uniref:Thermonuclease family protein n=1 Tax=Aliishimia ponticola TaxID=2499833 RepID=A0A4S4NI87_9RHOB|nr:thermonuclease family protein [Aliishimia ponticola]THH35810.1 thermonuclease family protein [Aliishimia ponticola]